MNEEEEVGFLLKAVCCARAWERAVARELVKSLRSTVVMVSGMWRVGEVNVKHSG